MLPFLTAEAAGAIPITPLAPDALDAWLGRQTVAVRRWVRSTRFAAKAGSVALIPDGDGRLGRVVAGLAFEDPIWEWAALPGRLPARHYRIDADLDPRAATQAALGWALETYRFERYRKKGEAFATLVWPKGCDRAAVERAAAGVFLARDLINTPAGDMGPAELAAAARKLAARHRARLGVIVGASLVRRGFPAIHAVGRASARTPRLIDLRWGRARDPLIAVCGKGVCFDSGGLDLKSASAMKLMKKDMGGAAVALGLAGMVMEAGLRVRLRVLIPAVENSVAGNALRPLDVIPTRKGLTVEIGNTDAEGRVVLADALDEASRDRPALLIDFATLTGAARVALGTELPALFCNDDSLAAELLAAGDAEADPLWRMPLWRPYRKAIEGKISDLDNAPEGGQGGAITAALFLAEFVGPGIPWAHLDLMAWNTTAKPGRPEGGEAMGMRAVFAALAKRFGRRALARRLRAPAGVG